MRLAAPIHRHRLTQLHRWAMLWLQWFAAFLDAACEYAPLPNQARAIAHGWLDDIEHVVLTIAINRAAPHVRLIYPTRIVEDLRQAGVRRAIIGARLRRQLRARDLHARAAALAQDINAFVARLLRRLPRGLTRRRPLRAQQQSAVSAPLAPIVGALGADTS